MHGRACLTDHNLSCTIGIICHCTIPPRNNLFQIELQFINVSYPYIYSPYSQKSTTYKNNKIPNLTKLQDVTYKIYNNSTNILIQTLNNNKTLIKLIQEPYKKTKNEHKHIKWEHKYIPQRQICQERT